MSAEPAIAIFAGGPSRLAGIPAPAYTPSHRRQLHGRRGQQRGRTCMRCADCCRDSDATANTRAQVMPLYIVAFRFIIIVRLDLFRSDDDADLEHSPLEPMCKMLPSGTPCRLTQIIPVQRCMITSLSFRKDANDNLSYDRSSVEPKHH